MRLQTFITPQCGGLVMFNGGDYFGKTTMMLIIYGAIWFIGLILSAVNHILKVRLDERTRERKIDGRGGGK